MVLITYNDFSLKKHGVSRAQVEEAFSDPMHASFDLPENQKESLCYSDRENTYRRMIIGHTYADVLLEIGVEMIGENALHIFHAQKVSPKYYKQYEHWLKNA